MEISSQDKSERKEIKGMMCVKNDWLKDLEIEITVD